MNTAKEVMIDELVKRGITNIDGVDLSACSDRELSYQLAIVKVREVDTTKAENACF
nr:hypothetical protein [Fredinandcohnia onubensis]